jgi:hypothetical protein
MLKIALHSSLSWARWIQFRPSQPIYRRSFLIFYSSSPRSSKWSPPLMLSSQTFVYISHLSHAIYMPRQSPPPWFDHPNNIWWRVQIMKLLIMQFSSASCHSIPLRFKYSPKHLFSNTINLCSCFNVRGQVSYSVSSYINPLKPKLA